MERRSTPDTATAAAVVGVMPPDASVIALPATMLTASPSWSGVQTILLGAFYALEGWKEGRVKPLHHDGAYATGAALCQKCKAGSIQRHRSQYLDGKRREAGTIMEKAPLGAFKSDVSWLFHTWV